MAGHELEPPDSSRSLDDLAAEIRREVEAAEAEYQSALQHAIRAGQLLLVAQERVGHGSWRRWLDANCPGGYSTAANYMRFARNVQRVAHLPTVREAIALLARSTDQSKPVPPQAEQLSAEPRIIYTIEETLPGIPPAAHQVFLRANAARSSYTVTAERDESGTATCASPRPSLGIAFTGPGVKASASSTSVGSRRDALQGASTPHVGRKGEKE